MSVIFDALRKLDNEESAPQTPILSESRLEHGASTGGSSAWIKACVAILFAGLVCTGVWFLYPKSSPEVIEANIPQAVKKANVETLSDRVSINPVMGVREPKKPPVMVTTPQTPIAENIVAKSLRASDVVRDFKAKDSEPAVRKDNRGVLKKELLAANRKARQAKVVTKPVGRVTRVKKGVFKRQQHIARLTPQLMQAMQQQKGTLVEKKLAELERISGTDNLFVLKMRAYWALQNKRFKQARIYYRNLLMKQPDDPESQVNMALVELGLNDVESAKVRLSALVKDHPDDKHIRTLLSQIKNR
ncbi:MAG: tetratricopeptide repeat protein [Mariprofundaceae bacterium]